MVSGRVFIFHICIPWGKRLSLVPKLRSYVKVKVKYHSYKSGCCGGICVSHTHLVCYVFDKQGLHDINPLSLDPNF